MSCRLVLIIYFAANGQGGRLHWSLEGNYHSLGRAQRRQSRVGRRRAARPNIDLSRSVQIQEGWNYVDEPAAGYPTPGGAVWCCTG